eukprot:Platyproteum_vivax@DN7726_c0_g1_i1.p1
MGPRKTNRESSSPGATTKTKGSRKKKDPNAPKKCRSAYMFFSTKRRPELWEQDPNLKSKVGDCARVIGAEWNQLSEKDRVPFQLEAEQDKKRYLEEMAQYKENIAAAGSS